MESGNEQFEIIKRYLLDQLDDEKAAEIDERLLNEPDLYAQISTVEQELLDDYQAGRLDPEARARVDFFYRNNPSQELKLRFARVVRELAADGPDASADHPAPRRDRPAPDKSAEKRPPGFFFRFRYALAGLALAAAAALLLILFFDGRRTVENDPEIAELNRLYGTGELPNDGRFVAVKLETDPGRAVGSTAPQVEITPAGRRIIALRLGLLTRRADRYEAAVTDENGRNRLTIRELQPQTAEGLSFVNVLVPERSLPPGLYKIRLVGRAPDGSEIEAGNFSFRTVPRGG